MALIVDTRVSTPRQSSLTPYQSVALLNHHVEILLEQLCRDVLQRVPYLFDRVETPAQK